jgi:hypothetical protein
MSVDGDVVGRVEERGVDRPVLADQGLEDQVPPVAAADPMLAQDPDVARLRARRLGDGRNGLVVRIAAAVENDVDLAGRETGRRQVEGDIEGRKFGKVELQEVEIPPGIERDLVVGQAQRPLLGLAEPAQDDGRDFLHPQDSPLAPGRARR